MQVRSGRIKRVNDEELLVPVLELVANSIRLVHLVIMSFYNWQKFHLDYSVGLKTAIFSLQ